VDPWESAKDKQVGMPGANAPSVGGGRLKLPRPSAARPALRAGQSSCLA